MLRRASIARLFHKAILSGINFKMGNISTGGLEPGSMTEEN
jgi:hypothetical protein